MANLKEFRLSALVKLIVQTFEVTHIALDAW